jgi:hypothetical protein
MVIEGGKLPAGAAPSARLIIAQNFAMDRSML